MLSNDQAMTGVWGASGVAPAAEESVEIVAQTADGFRIIGRQAVGKAREADRACPRLWHS
jgi:hypothetical protein